MKWTFLYAGVFGVSLALARDASADVVTYWDDVVASAIRADSTMPGPTWGARNMAMVHSAIYDAVNSIEGQYQPLHVSIPTPGASREAAASQAAYRVLSSLFPTQQSTFDSALSSSLAAIPDGSAKTDGVNLGEAVGNSIVAWRSTDGSANVVPYTLGSNPGEWRPTAPDFRGALGDGWGQVTPFVINSGDQFRAPPPPALTSPEYAAAVAQVQAYGEKNSLARTADQTEIGVFWGYDRGGMGPPPILYNQIAQVIAAQQGNTLSENARMFALLNVAMADSGITQWETKYYYNLWRPITAIREADTDDNPLTIVDPTWEPLGAPAPTPFTPPFPAYASGHATFGAAIFQTLSLFYGTDTIHFSFGSDELPGVVRSYDSFTQASEENAISRIYLGVHYSFDATEGIAMGNHIADYVFANSMTAVPEASGLVLGSSVLVSVLVLRHRKRSG